MQSPNPSPSLGHINEGIGADDEVRSDVKPTVETSDTGVRLSPAPLMFEILIIVFACLVVALEWDRPWQEEHFGRLVPRRSNAHWAKVVKEYEEYAKQNIKS